MLNQSSRSLSWLLALSLIAVACGDDDDDTGGTGGTSGKGGSMSTGGKSTTGGTTTSGGTSGKGGTMNGGNSTGGVSASGGTETGGTETGGTETGGTETGGTETGGTTTGGTTTGGTTTGGTTTGGTANGGTATGGTETGGAGGAAGEGGTTGEGGIGGFAGGDSVEGGAGGSGGEATVVPDTIDNPGFNIWDASDPLPNWTKAGDTAASFKEWKPGLGTPAVEGYVLSNWAATAFEVTTSQLVSPLPNGSYQLSIWHKGGAFITQRIFARGHDVSDPAAELTFDVVASETLWAEVVLTPIPITSGHVEIGIYSMGAANNWSHFEDVTLTKLP